MIYRDCIREEDIRFGDTIAELEKKMSTKLYYCTVLVSESSYIIVLVMAYDMTGTTEMVGLTLRVVCTQIFWKISQILLVLDNTSSVACMQWSLSELLLGMECTKFCYRSRIHINRRMVLGCVWLYM